MNRFPKFVCTCLEGPLGSVLNRFLRLHSSSQTNIRTKIPNRATTEFCHMYPTKFVSFCYQDTFIFSDFLHFSSVIYVLIQSNINVKRAFKFESDFRARTRRLAIQIVVNFQPDEFFKNKELALKAHYCSSLNFSLLFWGKRNHCFMNHYFEIRKTCVVLK